jgi:excinuclease ABC subunit C
MAVANAENQLMKDFERMKREDQRTKGAQNEILDLLGLDELHRIESYDISNTSGFASVGSMVVFVDGRPKNSDYRKFRIRSVTGPDDYASMREVLTRRFEHGLKEQQEAEVSGRLTSFGTLPDLIMMDGGRGQVNIAESVLEELGLDIPVSGMVKDDYHRTRGLYFHNEELPIDTRSEGFKLITRIQDETHRFAIEYHKSLRTKEQVHSVLDDIPGIGPKRRRALLKHFREIERLKAATVEELTEAEGMNTAAAESVYAFFHSGSV